MKEESFSGAQEGSCVDVLLLLSPGGQEVLAVGPRSLLWTEERQGQGCSKASVLLSEGAKQHP